jgi:hypothetical protein
MKIDIALSCGAQGSVGLLVGLVAFWYCVDRFRVCRIRMQRE